MNSKAFAQCHPKLLFLMEHIPTNRYYLSYAWPLLCPMLIALLQRTIFFSIAFLLKTQKWTAFLPSILHFACRYIFRRNTLYHVSLHHRVFLCLPTNSIMKFKFIHAIERPSMDIGQPTSPDSSSPLHLSILGLSYFELLIVFKYQSFIRLSLLHMLIPHPTMSLSILENVPSLEPQNSKNLSSSL